MWPVVWGEEKQQGMGKWLVCHQAFAGCGFTSH